MKTINLKGKQYAPVSARVEQFHTDHQDGSITTETTFAEGHVIVKATVSFGERVFNGHSYGTVKGEKAFEKLETTAVGRALAFAGYLAGGEIASYDEMQEFEQNEEPKRTIMTIEMALNHVAQSTDETDLTKRFKELSATMQKDGEVIAKCKELKAELSK